MDASNYPDNNQFISHIENINRLGSFLNLKQNWNNNNAKPFTNKLISKALNILNSLDMPPEIFPTGRDSIQFEYEKDNGDYLEFEIYANKILSLIVINNIPSEKVLSNKNQVERILTKFYA